MERCILIVEDHDVQAETLERIIKEYNSEYKVWRARTYDEALRLALRVQMDLLFVDIDLEGEKNGVDLAVELRMYPRYQKTWIVFSTVRREFEYDAFKKIHCYDYLIKPYRASRVRDIMQVLLENADYVKESVFVNLNLGEVVLKIDINEIIYVEADGRNVRLITVRAPYQLKYTNLKQVEETLAPFGCFLRIHRSYLVNINAIKEIQRISYKLFEVQLDGTEDRIFMSVSYKEAVEGRLKCIL